MDFPAFPTFPRQPVANLSALEVGKKVFLGFATSRASHSGLPFHHDVQQQHNGLHRSNVKNNFSCEFSKISIWVLCFYQDEF